MNVSCPDCRSVFRVDPAKVPATGVRARCSVCSGIISIPAPTGTNTPSASGPRIPPSAENPAQSRPRSAPPPQGAWDSSPFSTPSAPQPPAVTPPYVPPARTAAPVAPPPRAAVPAAAPAMTPSAPPPPPRPELAAPSASPVSTKTPPGARRPLNPFLSKDPNQRAKRLARALVSDIITYHPAKHAEGLRDGTLKQLFREEIKKSFEEYIAQVGQQLAESTTYFQEALNEVLAGGKKIF
ncbi:MAG: zinc-ribbon domain-containing protein [Gemmatimonadota bacterium]|nr:zinc-ribbon domain-containing protein [Gemmatimonadota bacterium]